MKNYSLRQHQSQFAKDYQRLIKFAFSKGYELTLGEVHRPSYIQEYLVRAGLSWTSNSQHTLKLAGDLNLFHRGKYLSRTIDHRILGRYWESLSPFNVWGGRFKDGNHYERRHDYTRKHLRKGKYRNDI